MGAWGIMERQSDNGLDLLSIVVGEQLRKIDFTVFNIAEAIKLLNEDTQNEIAEYRRKPPSRTTEFYIDEILMHNFTHAAILIAECLAEYYRTGELIVYDYVGETYDPVERHIREFVVTEGDLKHLLEELQSVQDPEHWLYCSWRGDETRKQWLEHIQSVYQTLKEHM